MISQKAVGLQKTEDDDDYDKCIFLIFVDDL